MRSHVALPKRPVLFTALLLLFVLVGVATWIRWLYIVQVGLHIDEFSSLWAVRRTLDHGVPLLPSGVFYTRGLFHTYVTALFAQIGGFDFVIGRLPSLFFAVASVTLIYLAGWKNWWLGTGVLAAIGLTLLPEAIEAGGRARFYAPMMFWSLLAAWSFFETIRHMPLAGVVQHRRRWHILFAASFVLAIFSHEEIVLLYPAILGAALLWRGWAYLRQPGALIVHAISVGAVALRLLLEQIGQPGQLLAIQSSQPYLAIYFDGVALWRLVETLFVESSRLPWTLGAIVAVVVALVQLRGQRWRLDGLPTSAQATLYFALLFGSVFFLFSTIVGASWRNPRYLLFLQSFWLLLGAAGITGGIAYFWRSAYGRIVATTIVSVLVISVMQERAVSTTQEKMLGYEDAFAYVAAGQMAGDIVMTPQAAGCALVLAEPCDYYTQGKDYEPFVLNSGGRLIDRWSGATLLATLAQLDDVLNQGQRVWFVIDGERLLKRFEEGFAREVLERFDVVRADDPAYVLRYTGQAALPPSTWRNAFAPINFTDWLTLGRFARSEVVPGQELIVRTEWILDEDAKSPSISVQLVSEAGVRPTSADGVLAEGVITAGQAEGAPIPDTKILSIPDSLAEGLYRIEIVAYQSELAEPFGAPIPVDWFRIGPLPESPTQNMSEQWRNGIELIGADDLPEVLAGGEPLSIRLRWQTDTPLTEELTAFAHLIGPEGALNAQDDHPPRHGFWPTSAWQPGVAVDDTYILTVPSTLAAGEYRLLVGWYHSATGERLRLADDQDALEIARWRVP